VFDPRRLRSLQPFSLEQSLDGALRLFEYEIDATSFLRVRPANGNGDGLHAEVVPIPTTLVPASVAGSIDEDSPSLFQSIEIAGEQPDLAIAMAQIFGGEIDFNTELQPGDRYTVAFDRLAREGRRSSYGAITAAEFQNDGRVVRAIRFTPKGGQPGYYDLEARSLRRFFLRSPLKFEPRVTSGFSSRRMHPVLHTARAHRGVTMPRQQARKSCLSRQDEWSRSHRMPRTAEWSASGMHRGTSRSTSTCLRLRPAFMLVSGLSRGRRSDASARAVWLPDRTCTTG
jgi:hypothetical protein